MEAAIFPGMKKISESFCLVIKKKVRNILDTLRIEEMDSCSFTHQFRTLMKSSFRVNLDGL